MKLPKGKVLGKYAGGPGVVLEALRQAPRGLNGYVRVVGPKGSGQIGVVLVIGGEPIGCLVTGGEQSFGKDSVPALHTLAADRGSQVRLIGFYDESMAEVKAAADNMRRVAGISRAELESLGAAAARGGRSSTPAAKAVADSVKADGELSGVADPEFLRELLEAGVRAAQEESRASGEPVDAALGGKLEEYLGRSDLKIDEAFATFATAMNPKPGAAAAAPKDRMPRAVADEFTREEEDLQKTAKQYEVRLAKEMGSAKALRDQELNLEKMEASLRDLKSSVQVEGERRLAEMEKLGRQAGPEAGAVLRKLREEQEAMYARVEKLVQMESLFQQNLLTQRRRINEKESELQQMASQLKQDFLERKRLLDEEKESYLEELRRQSKDLRTREQVAAQREKKAAELSDRLEGEIRHKIEQIEARREELEGREKELKARAETIASREAAAEGGGRASKAAVAALERERDELARERESFASRIASLAKREEELRALETRVGAVEADGTLRMSPEQLEEAREVVKFLDKLLEMLPEDKVSEFAQSDYYQMYVRLLERLGL